MPRQPARAWRSGWLVLAAPLLPAVMLTALMLTALVLAIASPLAWAPARRSACIRRAGKPVSFDLVDMNHVLDLAKAAIQERPAPADFRGATPIAWQPR